MTEYGKIVRRRAPVYNKYDVDKNGVEKIISHHRGEEKFLPQDDVFKILRCYGIATVKSVRIRKKAELDSAASKIKYPLVLKVDAEEIIHKTEVGGVSLNLKDNESLQVAFNRMVEKFAEEKPSFILQEYLESGKEVIMGAKKNEGVQPTLMFGLGGIFVETIKDVQFRLAPLSREDTLEMIHSIKGHSILEGVRREKAVDIDALAEILIRLSQLASDFPEIDEMDLNPIFAFKEGKGAKAVDARLKIVGF
jgi:acyl-CoA synthetase (NDP forming)